MIHYRLPEKDRDILSDLQKFPELSSLFLQMREHHLPSYQHVVRVALVAEDFAEKLGFSEEDCMKARKGALLHDLGKLNVPQEILNAEKKPEGEEWELLKRHVLFTREYLLGSGIEDRDVLYIALAHHEFQRESYSRQKNGVWLATERRLVNAPLNTLAQIVVLADKLDASLYRKDQIHGHLSPQEKIARDFTGDHALIPQIMQYVA